MIIKVTIIRLDFEHILISCLDEYKEEVVERNYNPEVYYEIENGELARVKIEERVFSMMECRGKIALYLQNHRGFETVGKEVPLEFNFIVKDNG